MAAVSAKTTIRTLDDKRFGASGALHLLSIISSYFAWLMPAKKCEERIRKMFPKKCRDRPQKRFL
jgi:hypothetical protein